MEDNKELVQAAGSVLESLTKLRRSRYTELAGRLAASVNLLRELATESRKMGISLKRGWFAAADKCRNRTANLLTDIAYSITQVKQFAEKPQKKAPNLAFLVEELSQLYDEFDCVEFEKDNCAISVVTDPIVLDDIPLGAFKIQLCLNKFTGLYNTRPYQIIALNPNPASSDENVTHSHVNGEKLCEGDGAAAITAALEQGRLVDFFTMIRSILTTYNPDSPYIALHDWDGSPCHDCGYTMSSEDTYFCQYCQYDYCHDCSTYCRQCEETVCLGCAVQCPHCEEPRCRECISKCSECEEFYCEDCLEEGVCPTCKEEMENDNEEQQENTEQKENSSQPQTVEAEIKLAG